MFNFDKEHIIFSFAHRGALSELQSELAQNPELLQLKASNGSTLLMFAAQMGHLHIVEWLVNKGVALDDRAANGYNALMFAAFDARVTTVKYLLDKGATLPQHRGFWLYTTANAHSNIIKWLCRKMAVWQATDSIDSNALPEKLAKRIYGITEFTVVLPYLDAKQIKILVAHVQQKFPKVLENIRLRQFASVWGFLVSEQRHALVCAFQEQIPQFIDQAQKKKRYAKNLWDVLTPEQRMQWLSIYANPNSSQSPAHKLSMFSNKNQPQTLKTEKERTAETLKADDSSVDETKKHETTNQAQQTFFSSSNTEEAAGASSSPDWIIRA